ncbi:hypothetical protein SVAN01_07999 [Stagonosporopsis vannaccii]|nr:hypothetical protein SVAN01_07999 [Stagonosporopsis vannaccii]
MDPLDSGTPFTFIPYLQPLPPLDTQLPLTVLQTSTWTYSGPLLSPVCLPPSLHNWSAAALSSPSALLQRLHPLLSFLHLYLRDRGVKYYWITLRATTPTAEYDVPRWHVDDDFFGDGSSTSVREVDADAVSHTRRSRWTMRSKTPTRSRNLQNADTELSDADGVTRQTEGSRCDWKLCTALLGPGTLFLPLPHHRSALQSLHATKSIEATKREHVCSSIRCTRCGDTGDAVRQVLATSFAKLTPVQSTYGSLAVFRTGEGGAVHSEPSCNDEGGRLFVNIVPGTEEGLRALMGRFGMEWPRSWSMGVLSCAGAGLMQREGEEAVEGEQETPRMK